MPTHEFTIRLFGVSDMTDEQFDALYEAGCDDATISSRAGLLKAARRQAGDE